MANSKWLKPVPPPENVSQSDVRRVQQEKARRADEDSTHHSPPVPTTPPDSPPLPKRDPSPKRDFNKRANSLERDAMPAGLFPGSTFKIYNALYIRSRGALVPSRRVRASRRDFLEWTDIRNLKTVDNHLRYLMAKGLIVRRWELGSTEGSEYEVFLPEEVSPPVTTTPHQSPPATTSQNMTGGDSQRSGSGGYSQATDFQRTSAGDKTFIDKDQINDDEPAAAFKVLCDKLQVTSTDLTGKPPTRAEAEKWGELAEVLVTELRIAAGRTTVSSVPAFLAEHLRRRLFKKDKVSMDREAAETTATAPPNVKECPDCAGLGLYYPEGFEKGVARCPHDKLRGGE